MPRGELDIHDCLSVWVVLCERWASAPANEDGLDFIVFGKQRLNASLALSLESRWMCVLVQEPDGRRRGGVVDGNMKTA